MQKIIFSLICLLGTMGVYSQNTINASTFGLMEARYLGPGTMSGRITDIVGLQKDSGKTIYVGTAGGGIWKSTTAGFSFKPIFDKHNQSIGALAVDQNNSKTIYAGTGESNMRNTVSIGDGLYKSTDGGDNWVKIGLDSTEHISKILIDPKDANTLYVSCPGPLWSDSKHRGLYKSTDAGKTWNKILYVNEKTGVADVELDPSNPSVLYATTWEFRRMPYSFNSGGQGSGIYKSTDGGKSWKELSKGLPAKPFGRVALALAPSSPQNLWAIVESENTGLYISSDGGENWKELSATANIRSRPFYFSTLEVDPKDPKRVYRPAFNFAYSSDGGYSFAEASEEGGWIHSDHHALWINPYNTNILYLGTDGGVYYSMDRGANWKFVNNLPVGQFYHVSFDNRNPYRVYGGLQDNGSWVAPSTAPGGVLNGDWKSIFGGDGFWVQPDAENSDIVYAEYQGGNIFRVRVSDGTNVGIKPQSDKGNELLRFNWNTPIVLGAKNPKNLYTASQYLYKSSNRGANWEKISPDLTTNDKKKQEQEKSGGVSMDITSAENHCTIFTVAESPLDEKLIWVGTDDGNIHYTLDGGKNWVNVSVAYASSGIPAGTWVSSIEPSRFDRNTVYATFDNHTYGDHKTYLAKTEDLGKTWKRMESPEFTGFAHKIKEDLQKKDLLFLGTEMGLFISLNGGKEWFRMKSNLPWYALVRDIQIHPETNDLLLATHGRGILIIPDITPFRTLSSLKADDQVVFLNNRPIVLSSGKYSGSFPNSSGEWNGGISNNITPIEYYLRDRANSIQMEIVDQNGKLVNKLNPSNRKGYNKVVWNQRGIPPKVAKGGSQMEQSAFVGMQILPGNYTLKMKMNGKEFQHPLIFVHDSTDQEFKPADRQLQYQTGKKLYVMSEELSLLVDSIQNRQQKLQKSIDSAGNVKSKKVLQTYYDALENLRLDLVPPVVKGTGEIKRLRSDISDLYAGIVGQQAAPGNLQLKRAEGLQEEVVKATRRFEQLKKDHEPKVKNLQK